MLFLSAILAQPARHRATFTKFCDKGQVASGDCWCKGGPVAAAIGDGSWLWQALVRAARVDSSRLKPGRWCASFKDGDGTCENNFVTHPNGTQSLCTLRASSSLSSRCVPGPAFACREK